MQFRFPKPNFNSLILGFKKIRNTRKKSRINKDMVNTKFLPTCRTCCSSSMVAWDMFVLVCSVINRPGVAGAVLQSPSHKCFKCWWQALPEKKRITEPLINSTFNHGLHEGPSYAVLTIIK